MNKSSSKDGAERDGLEIKDYEGMNLGFGLGRGGNQKFAKDIQFIKYLLPLVCRPLLFHFTLREYVSSG